MVAWRRSGPGARGREPRVRHSTDPRRGAPTVDSAVHADPEPQPPPPPRLPEALDGGDHLRQFGTQITQLALPLIATTTLDVSPFEVGLLTTIEFLPFILFSLPAGVWVDRLPRRPILIAGDSRVPWRSSRSRSPSSSTR